MLGNRPPLVNSACYHSQQAVEKALKAVLIRLQHPFPFTHDHETLRAELPDGWTAKDQPVDFKALTDWAAAERYPTDKPEPDLPEARIAVRAARLVVEAAARDLAARGLETGR